MLANRPRAFVPWAYQLLIIKHILKLPRCAIWAGMGMGKTSSALTAIDLLYLSGDLTGPVLVLAPKRVAMNVWPKEVRKWAHLSDLHVQPILGNERERRQALTNRKAQIFTINYENVPWLRAEVGNDWPFKMVVSDESTRLKSFRVNQGGARAQALKDVSWEFVERFVELTGTPSPNGLKDLWGQIWFIDKGRRLGASFKAFAQRWFTKGYDGYSITPHDHAQGQIQDLLKDICLSLNPKDYFDLREPRRHIIHVDLPPEARKAYKEMETEMFLELQENGVDHEIEAFNAASKTQKLLQLANGAIYLPREKGPNGKPLGKLEWAVVHDTKLEALESIVEEAAGMPVLVAYQFKSDLARIKKAFPKAREFDDKPKTEDEWNDGKIPMLLAHPASAGHGSNLQYGSHIIIFFGHDWDLELWEQIRERLGPVRQLQAGLDRVVDEYYIVARGTMDEVVMKRRETKKSVQDLLLSAMKHRNEERI